MRWADRFDALEAEVRADDERELAASVAEQTRARMAEISWVDRCRGAAVGLEVLGVGPLRGVVDTVTRDWLLLHAGDTADWVVARAAVLTVRDAPGRLAPAGGEVAERLTWRHAFSVLSRDRDRVHLVRIDGSAVTGVPERVGRDHAQLGGELVPYAAVAAVRTPR